MSWELFAVFLGSSIRLATPLLLAGIGEMVSERAGVLNMSIEGMMLTSAFASAVGAWATGDPLIGLLIGIIAVQPVALLQAVLSNTLRANQIVSGTACDCEAAWRGAFLAHGSLTEPGRSMALEVTCPGSEAALALVGAARRLKIHAKAREVRDRAGYRKSPPVREEAQGWENEAAWPEL